MWVYDNNKKKNIVFVLILQKENDWNEKTQSAIIRTVKTSAQQKKMKGTNRRGVKKNRELIY